MTPLNCLNVYSSDLGYCICTEAINDKTNEIPTVEKIVKNMDLTGVIVTFDALNFQTKNISAIKKFGGDYIVPIKGNQGTFYQDLMDYFDDNRCNEISIGNTMSAYKTYIEKGHSSIIKYEFFQTSDIHWYKDLEK